MRLLIDSLIATMLVMILAGVVWAHRAGRQIELAREQVYDALAALHEQAVYHGALGDAELTETGFPKQIAPSWFTTIPFNRFADARRPWIDVAPPGDTADHPPDPILHEADRDQAGFWYNPARGVFRARVPALATDTETLALYNRVNNAALRELPRRIDEARQPIAHAPLPPTTRAADAHAQTTPPDVEAPTARKRPTLRAD